MYFSGDYKRCCLKNVATRRSCVTVTFLYHNRLVERKGDSSRSVGRSVGRSAGLKRTPTITKNLNKYRGGGMVRGMGLGMNWGMSFVEDY